MKPIKQSELLSAIATILNQCAPIGPSASPLRKERPPDVAAPPQKLPGEDSASLHILIAEDNLVNQKLAMRVLEKRKHTVVVVENGRQAVIAVEKEHFDLVLMDVQMPEMGGFEATAAIREKEKLTGAHLPIIAMTANAMEGDREKCLEAGMDDYISKPIQVKQLFETIAALAAPAREEMAKC